MKYVLIFLFTVLSLWIKAQDEEVLVPNLGKHEIIQFGGEVSFDKTYGNSEWKAAIGDRFNHSNSFSYDNVSFMQIGVKRTFNPNLKIGAAYRNSFFQGKAAYRLVGDLELTEQMDKNIFIEYRFRTEGSYLDGSNTWTPLVGNRIKFYLDENKWFLNPYVIFAFYTRIGPIDIFNESHPIVTGSYGLIGNKFKLSKHCDLKLAGGGRSRIYPNQKKSKDGLLMIYLSYKI